jgi:hypothetical protein
VNNEYIKWLRSQNELDHNLDNIGYARKQRMKDWHSKVLRILTIIFLDDWDHLCVLVLS